MFGSWPSRLQIAFSATTARGRAFLAGGLTATLCGVLLGERDLVRIGGLVALIPIVAVVFAARSALRLTLVRRLDHPVITVGQEAAVSLELTNLGRRTGALLLEERIPWSLGNQPRFRIGPLPAGSVQTLGYSVRPEARGRHHLGPLRVRFGDPFGMLSLVRTFPRTTTVDVLPTIEALPQGGSLRADGTGGEGRPQPFSLGGGADVSVRQYHQGDDLRRVHWRSTARTGDLMVRQDEESRRSTCTIFLDNRTSAHRGVGNDHSLERAVGVAASVAFHLEALGYDVCLVDADGHDVRPVPGEPTNTRSSGDARSSLIGPLALLTGLPSERLHPRRPGHVQAGDLFIGILGSLDAASHHDLGAVPTQWRDPYAIVLDVDSWGSQRSPSSSAAPLGAAATLRSRGWMAIDLPRTGSLPEAWKALSR